MTAVEKFLVKAGRCTAARISSSHCSSDSSSSTSVSLSWRVCARQFASWRARTLSNTLNAVPAMCGARTYGRKASVFVAFAAASQRHSHRRTVPDSSPTYIQAAEGMIADDGDNGGQAIHEAGAVENESAHAMPKLTEVQRFCSNAGAGASVEVERTLPCRPRPRRNNRTHPLDEFLIRRDRPSRIGKDREVEVPEAGMRH